MIQAVLAMAFTLSGTGLGFPAPTTFASIPFPAPAAGHQAAPAGQAGRTPAGQATPVPTDPWPAWPAPPIYRGKPRAYTAGVDLTVSLAGDGSFGPLVGEGGGTLTISAVTADPFCVADLQGLQLTHGMDGHRLEGPENADQRFLVFQVPRKALGALQIRASWPVISFASLIDEKAAAQIAWPRAWTPEDAMYLQPTAFIESDHERFKEYVQSVAGDRLRRTPIYLAAKDLVRSTILEFRVINQTTMVMQEPGLARGYRVVGALQATSELAGAPADLVCACVAVLRAAGIPARPVIGADYGRDHKEKSKLPRGRTSMCVWAEFKLPGAGWVPFDPWQMRGQGLAQKDVAAAWRWFGSIEDLNRRIALGYDFAPYAFGRTPDWPAGWSWRVNERSQPPGQVTNVITPIMVSRGSVRP